MILKAIARSFSVACITIIFAGVWLTSGTPTVVASALDAYATLPSQEAAAGTPGTAPSGVEALSAPESLDVQGASEAKLSALEERIASMEKKQYAAAVVVAAFLAVGAAIMAVVGWAAKTLVTQQVERLRTDVTANVRTDVAAASDRAQEARTAVEDLWNQNKPLLEEVKRLAAVGADASQVARGDPDALYRLAEEEWSEGHRARASGILAQIIDSPAGAASWVLLYNANVLARQLEDESLAGRIAQKAYNDYPGVTRCALLYARTLGRSGRVPEARTVYEKLLTAGQDEEEVARQYIDFLRGAGLFDEGEAFYDERKEKFQNSSGIRAELGDLRRSKGDMESAEAEFRAAIELGKTNDLPMGYLALLLYQLGKLDEAESTVRKAIRVAGEESPRRGEHFLLLGHILREKGDSAGAKGAYSAALIFDPGAIEALRWLRTMGVFAQGEGLAPG
jgi:tetratricopeptide (TPR) repeat protein